MKNMLHIIGLAITGHTPRTDAQMLWPTANIFNPQAHVHESLSMALADAGMTLDDPLLSRARLFFAGDEPSLAEQASVDLGLLELPYRGDTLIQTLLTAQKALLSDEIDLAFLWFLGGNTSIAFVLCKADDSVGRAYACLEILAEDVTPDAEDSNLASIDLCIAPLDNAFLLHYEKMFGVYDPGARLRAFVPFSALSLDLFVTCLGIWQKIIPFANYNVPTSFFGLPFYYNQEPRPWIHHPSYGARQAILLDPTSNNMIRLEEAANARPFLLAMPTSCETFFFTGEDTDGLWAQCQKFLVAGRQEGFTFSSLAKHSLALADARAPMRLAIVAEHTADLEDKIKTAMAKISQGEARIETSNGIFFCANAQIPPGKVASLFPGQGFPGLMGNYSEHLKELCLRFPPLREVFDKADRRDSHPEDRIPLHMMFFPPTGRPEEERERLKRRVASPVIADVERCEKRLDRKVSMLALSVSNWAAWSFLQSAKLRVDAVFGQSLGELAALAAAGAIEFTEMVTLLQAEPDFDTSYYGMGRMFATTAPLDVIEATLPQYPSVAIAVYVAPDFNLLAGDQEEASAMAEVLQNQGYWVQLLPYPAIHTPRMSGLAKAGQALWDAMHVKPLKIPVYSGTTADLYPTEVDAIRQRMVSNYDHPVKLWQTQRKMYEDGFRVFVQSGGGSTMYAQVKTNINQLDIIATSFDVEYREPMVQMGHMMGLLWSHGVAVDPSILFTYRFIAEMEKPLPAPTSLETLPIPEKEELPLKDRQEAKMPFVGDIVAYEEGHSITVDRILDIEEDWHLKDHTFVPAYEVKPLWACMPVMPITMTLEAMAEVASLLAESNMQVTAFEEIHANKWVALEDTEREKMTIYAEVILDDPESQMRWVYCEVYVGDAESPATTGVVRFGVMPVVTVELDFAGMSNMQAYDLTPEEAYRSGYLFHGPIYQGIQEVTTIFDEGIVGKIAVAPKDRLFRSTANPILLVDPVFLDVIGQLFGLWAIPQKKYIFPLYIEKIEIYEPTPPVGSVLPVWVKVTDMKFHTVSADMEIQDEEGNVWMRVKCWQDWIFRWPPHYYGIRRRPKKYLLSSPLPIAVADENVAIFALEDIEKLPGADIEFLARAYLTMEEYARYRQFAGKPRAIEWLMGRLVAKDAVRAFHARHGADEYLHPASFALEADDSGKPYVAGIEGETIQVSLAHKDRYAIAVASTFPVGIDLEKMEPRQKGFAQMILNEEEKPFLQDLSEKLGEDVALTLLFSAKEAASKAIGTGLRPSPKAFQIVRLADQRLWVQVQDQVIPVQCYFDENWIITIAMMDAEQAHV